MDVSKDVTMTLRAQEHGHQPIVCAAFMGGQAHGVCYVIDGNVVDRASTQNGRGWCEDVSPTLNTQDKHAVAFAVDALSSNSMKSSNPHSGFHETKISKCLDTSCCEPTCNQGGVLIVVDCCS